MTPPGQHATFAIGGDAYSDEGARDAGEGALTGALAGAAAGVLIGAAVFAMINQWIVVFAGAGLGAYVGSLVGALSKMRAGKLHRATPAHPVERKSGPMVAALVDRPGAEARAIETLQRCGAHHIERTEGKWSAGDWQDFDPRVPSPAEGGAPRESVLSNVTAEGVRKMH